METKEMWTSLASLLGVFAFCQSLLHTVIPPDLRYLVARLFGRLFQSFSAYCYFDIVEMDGVSSNELYSAVQLYLSTSASVSATRLSLTRPPNSSAFTFGLSNNDRLLDSFRGVPAVWEHVVTQRQSQTFSWRPLPEEKRGFTLTIKKKDKPLVLDAYLDHIMEKAAELRRKNQDRLLYTNSRGGGGGGGMDSRGYPWESVPFKHPSTFSTLAMDPDKKEEIKQDLKDFAAGKSFYEKTGRAWKRGYLLYGPPGTGKSSMIAAMANFLGYDIYDLELTEVHTNTDLRKLLMKTASKSIIVIEDIDCSVSLTNRKGSGGGSKPTAAALPPTATSSPKSNLPPGAPEDPNSVSTKSITLSGLLNFTDGLWSCCGSERIFVFTTNHVERLDPALLRSGRMDMHIFMSYCSFPALKILMKNYLGLEDGEELGEDGEGLMRELEEVIGAAEITPADVSEVLIKNRRREKVRALRELLEVLKGRAMERRTKKKKKKKNGGGGEEGLEDEEEQKRTRESPKEEEEESGEEGMCNGKVLMVED